MQLDEFVALFGQLSAVQFERRFGHPFLLERVPDEETATGRRVFLCQGSEGKSLVIGRGPRCHVSIAHRLLSTKHAELRPPTGEGDWFIVDLGSTNGTQLGDEPLAPQVPARLRDGDELTLGTDLRLSFLSSGSLHALLAELQEALDGSNSLATCITIAPDRSASRVRDRPTEKHSPVRPRADAAGDELLILCEGRDATPFPMDAVLVVGRSAEHAQLVLPESRVSRRHAELKRTSEGLFLRDLGSANGTLLVGSEVGSDWTPFLPGQVITVGPFHLYAGGPQSTGTSDWNFGDEA